MLHWWVESKRCFSIKNTLPHLRCSRDIFDKVIPNQFENARDQMGRKSAQQYIGEDAGHITLSGEILPHWKGGTTQLDTMRAQAGFGRPFLLVSGTGQLLGDWTIQTLTESGSEFLADGTPRVIGFSVKLQEYGDEFEGMQK